MAARFLSSRDQITQSGKIVRRIIQSVSEDEAYQRTAGPQIDDIADHIYAYHGKVIYVGQ